MSGKNIISQHISALSLKDLIDCRKLYVLGYSPSFNWKNSVWGKLDMIRIDYGVTGAEMKELLTGEYNKRLKEIVERNVAKHKEEE